MAMYRVNIYIHICLKFVTRGRQFYLNMYKAHF
jgi:hypothetical protein